MSITELTTRAGWIAGLAILALLFAGWRKTARAAPVSPRRPDARVRRRRGVLPVAIAEYEVDLHHRAGVLRRAWAVVAGSALALVTGAVVATVIGFGTAWLVTTMTDLLKR